MVGAPRYSRVDMSGQESREGSATTGKAPVSSLSSGRKATNNHYSRRRDLMQSVDKFIRQRNDTVYFMQQHSPEHLCSFCPKAPPDIEMTTVDMNECPWFTRDERILVSDGNSRIYADGKVTVDNGGGYDVIRCPYMKA